VAARLRHFELALLGLCGFAVDLERDAAGGAPLGPCSTYEYRLEQGPVPAARREGRVVLTGAGVPGRHGRNFAWPAVLRAAGRLLREVLTFHLGGRELKSRRVLRDMRRAVAVPADSRADEAG